MCGNLGAPAACTVLPGRGDQGVAQAERATADRGAAAVRMNWARRLKRVFAIDIEKCGRCGGRVRVIAAIEDPEVVEKILRHLGLEEGERPARRGRFRDATHCGWRLGILLTDRDGQQGHQAVVSARICPLPRSH